MNKLELKREAKRIVSCHLEQLFDQSVWRLKGRMGCPTEGDLYGDFSEAEMEYLDDQVRALLFRCFRFCQYQ